MTSKSGRTNRLVWLLRILGGVNIAAVVAVVAPRSWLAWCHELLGLGVFPTGSITGYLARSTSLWFTGFGVLLWFVSREVNRHSAIITFIGWAMTLQGGSMIIIDWHEGLPVWWIIAEGPSCMGLGLLMLALRRTSHAAEISARSLGEIIPFPRPVDDHHDST